MLPSLSRCCWLVLMLGILVPTASRADDVYGRIILTDGTHTRGIEVRRTDNRVIFATGNGIITTLPGRVSVSVGMTDLTAEINQVLNIIDRRLTQRQFFRIDGELAEVDELVQELEARLQSRLSSSVATEAEKVAIRGMLAYYREQLRRVRPTMRVIELAEEVVTLEGQFRMGRLDADQKTLLQLIQMQKQLDDVEQETPMAEKERNNARGLLQKIIQRIAEEQRENVLTEYSRKLAIQPTVQLLNTLAAGADSSVVITEEQRALIDAVVATTARRASPLPDASRKVLLVNEEGVRFFPEPYNELRQLIIQQLIPAITAIRDATFGSEREDHQARLNALLKDLREGLDRTAERVAALKQVAEAFETASTSFDEANYSQAVAGYQQALSLIDAFGMGDAPVHEFAAEELLRSQAMVLRERLRTAALTPREQLDDLINSSQAFVGANREQLDALGISRRDLENAIRAVDYYRRYLERKAQVMELRQHNSVAAWNLVRQLNETMEMHKGLILPAAVIDWEDYLQANENAIFSEANQAFLSKGESLTTSANQDLFISFVTKFIEDGDYSRALQSVNQVLEEVAGQAEAEPFMNELLNRKLQVAQLYENDGNFTAALEVYSELMAPDYERFATRRNLRPMVAQAKLSLAELHAREGRAQAAIALYENIAADSPEFAEENQLVRRALRLATREHGDVVNPLDEPELLALYNRYSTLFPGQVRILPPVQHLLKQISERFREHWDAGEPELALERYQQLRADYPALTAELELARRLLLVVFKRMNMLANPANDTADAATARVSNAILEAAAQVLALPELEGDNRLPVTQESYVTVIMQRAENFLTLGQVERAFALYDQIDARYPEIAAALGIEQIKEDKRWNLRMEKIRRPLRIRGTLDWAALFAWTLIWAGFFIFALRRGKKRGDRRYRINHFINVFGVFIFLLLFFLLFDLAHSRAFALAFVLPGLIFNTLGIATYRFFPLIYHERRLMLERAFLTTITDTPLRAATSDQARNKLRRHVRDVEEMVALMHDRQLFDIHVAIRRADSDPARGIAALEKLRQQMEQVEPPRRDPTWRERHAMIVHQLGLVAHRQGNHQQARKYLETYVDYEPKDVEARLIVGDICYDAGDYQDAIPHLKVSLAAHGQDEQLWFKLGRCFFETQMYPASYKCFEAAKHKNRDILFWGARAFARAGERERAAKWYQALLKKHANDTDAVYYLASTFAELGQHLKALKVASVIKEDDPRYPAALTLQGNILFKRDELQKAQVFFGKALEIDPTFVPALLGNGQIFLAANKLNDALKQFSAIVDLQPEHPAGNYYLGVLLQQKAPERALEHFKKAVRDPAFKQWAARRIGFVSFFLKDSDVALEYFSMAEEEGEDSPWFLFLFAYLLASRRELRRCEQVVIKILGRTTQSQDWSAHVASQGMYSIGVMLFEQHAYKMAHQCFEFVRENPLPERELGSVAAFLEEARFRMVVNWLEQGEYIEAQARCAELQMEAQDPARHRSCQYYMALCHLFQGQYHEAAGLLNELVQDVPNNPRYRYHLIIAELGCGQEKEAREAMNAFAGMSDRPSHLAAGLVTIQAYLSASRGKVQDAERSLARVSLPDGGSDGDAYLREKIILARIYYLCQLQDYDTIVPLVQQLPDDQRANALYMEAISCLYHNDYSRAIDFMRPFADKSERDRRLFLYLTSQLAVQELRAGHAQAARRVLRDIPKPPREITTILSAWEVSEQLTHATSAADLDGVLQSLQSNLGKMEDEYLNYFVLHNLAVLHLRRAYFMEDDARADDDAKQAAWQQAIDFWYTRVFTSQSFWNLAQSRFAEDPKKTRPFAAEDTAKITQAAKDQYFINAFVGLTLHYLAEGNETGVSRHLQLLHDIADRDNKLKVYFRRLGEKVEKYLRSIDKSNALWNTWTFTIASLDLQVRIAEVLGLDHNNASSQLDLYRQTRERYDSPAEYQRAKRHFNTVLLEAIQVGVRGSFSEAGQMIDEILQDVPPGVDLSKLEDNLRLLREACKNPAAYAERGVNLSQQFERVYATARTINTGKGK